MDKTCKYYKYQRYVSYDNGQTWQPLNEYQRGELMEFNSPDCGAGISELYKWVLLSGEYECVGYGKYEKTQKYVSFDNGVTYSAVTPSEYGIGALIESKSEDCGYEPSIEYRWVNLDPSIDFYCDECDVKLSGFKTNGETFLIECNTSSTITQTEVGGITNIDYASMGNCVTDIGDMAFAGSTVGGVNISSTVTSIGNSAFYGCTNLQGITIPDSVTSIGVSAFSNCVSATLINMGDNITNIGVSAFENCDSIKNIHISSRLVSIPNNCFNGCGSLLNAVIPNSVTSIGDGVFSGCISLTSVTIGSSVTSIGNNAFYDCRGLQSVTCLATTPPTAGTYMFRYGYYPTIYVPCESINQYKLADEWYNYRDNIHGIPPCEEPPSPETFSVTYNVISAKSSNNASLKITVKDDDGFEKTITNASYHQSGGGIYNIPGTLSMTSYLGTVNTLNEAYIKTNTYTVTTTEGHIYTVIVESRYYKLELYSRI